AAGARGGRGSLGGSELVRQCDTVSCGGRVAGVVEGAAGPGGAHRLSGGRGPHPPRGCRRGDRVSLVVVAGGKGAPGATTTALGLASAWTGQRRVVVEADPDGGVLAARLGLGLAPGLMTVAAAPRPG